MVPLPGFPTGIQGVPVGGAAPTTGPNAGAVSTWLNYTIPGNRNLVSVMPLIVSEKYLAPWQHR